MIFCHNVDGIGNRDGDDCFRNEVIVASADAKCRKVTRRKSAKVRSLRDLKQDSEDR